MFRNINTVLESATQVNTIPVEQNQGYLPFDYNLLARKIIASEEFQHVLINQLNISQSDLVKLHDQEFQHLLKNQLEKMNSENLNWINVSLYWTVYWTGFRILVGYTEVLQILKKL